MTVPWNTHAFCYLITPMLDWRRLLRPMMGIRPMPQSYTAGGLMSTQQMMIVPILLDNLNWPPSVRESRPRAPFSLGLAVKPGDLDGLKEGSSHFPPLRVLEISPPWIRGDTILIPLIYGCFVDIMAVALTSRPWLCSLAEEKRRHDCQSKMRMMTKLIISFMRARGYKLALSPSVFGHRLCG